MFDSDSGSFGLRFLIAALVVGLALACFFAAVAYIRRRNSGMPFLGQPRARHQRLNIVESVAVDNRRRLVLVRRDNVEHLLLLGGGADLVVEQNIYAPYEASEPAYEDVNYYQEEDEPEEIYEAEPAPAPEPVHRPPAPQASTRPDDQIGIRYTAAWEDEEEDLAEEPPLRPVRKVEIPAELKDVERLPNEPPVGTIRPVTLSRAERPQPAQPAPSAPARPTTPAVSAEEAALARQLEAARRGGGQPAPQRTAMPLPATRNDFDRVLEQEMEDQLEAARRTRPQPAPGQRPVVQQPRREDGQKPTAQQNSLQSGFARIFGGKGEDKNG